MVAGNWLRGVFLTCFVRTYCLVHKVLFLSSALVVSCLYSVECMSSNIKTPSKFVTTTTPGLPFVTMAPIDTAEARWPMMMISRLSPTHVHEGARARGRPGILRGFRYDYGGLKIDLLPPSKAKSPPKAEGGWRRPVPCCCCSAALFH